MAKEITTIETTLYETTGEPGPFIQHEIAAFQIISTTCRVRLSPEGDMMFLSIGQRDFSLSMLDLAATAALAVDGHLRAEIKARVLGNRKPVEVADSLVPARGIVEADGFITLHPRRP
ncbi:hypothetical protein [Pararhodobacter zhoushanensis]|uniref:Uncharacterized protein n=1 Tax=Pararhodobacter zhoushanensis TaxID=2479545 RepID=A0ABT3H2R9_9RHOB|nr:hypothetical protein [Pararhodobacter zhoushanensis]MCW1934099.1 hypothetical protein [Pararhodobacter zhoushanensis]